MAEKKEAEEGTNTIGALVDRRDDDLLLQAIQEDKDAEDEAIDSEEGDSDEEEGDTSSDEEEGDNSDNESCPNLNELNINDDNEDGNNEEDDMNALINKMMERRRMDDADFEEMERELDELKSDEENDGNISKEKSSSSKQNPNGGQNNSDSDSDAPEQLESPLRQIKMRVHNQIIGSPETGKGDDSDSENEKDNLAYDSDAEEAKDGQETVPQIENQIHVLRRKKREKLTPAEIREKMKNKAKQQNFRNAGKNKGQKKMKNEFKSACQDFGVN